MSVVSQRICFGSEHSNGFLKSGFRFGRGLSQRASSEKKPDIAAKLETASDRGDWPMELKCRTRAEVENIGERK